MRTAILVTCVSILAPAVALADAPREQPVDATIRRGLDFLAQDAVAWREQYKCVSCHHAALIVSAMREAKAKQITVDEPLLAELNQWLAESGDGTTGVPRPEGIPKAFNEKAVSFLAALHADPAPDETARQGAARMLKTALADQLDNGSWASWPDTRPPLFGHSDERATAAATLVLLTPAAAGDAAAQAARDRGVEWLRSTPSDNDPQSVALRLILWSRLNLDEAESRALAEKVLARQNADGGWSQTSEMPSDAWATGQALYALAHAGFTASDERVARGQAFLSTNQRADGSWPMISRPTRLGGEGGKNLMPITGAGSAWAVMGLVRSR